MRPKSEDMATSQIKQTGKPILDLRKEKLRPWRQDQVRQQIQVSKILNLLQDHVLTGTEIASTRLSTGLALLKKVLPDAIPDAVSDNLQANTAQALQAIQQAQLMAMAQEMIRQGNVIEGQIESETVLLPSETRDTDVVSTDSFLNQTETELDEVERKE